MTLTATGAVADDFTFYIAVNGTVIANSGAKAYLDTVQSTHVGVHSVVDLTNGDFIEVFVENNDATNNLTVEQASFTVR